MASSTPPTPSATSSSPGMPMTSPRTVRIESSDRRRIVILRQSQRGSTGARSAIRGMTLIESGLTRHKPRSRLRVYLTRIRIFPTSGEARGSPRATPRGRQGRRRRALGPAFGDSLIVVPRYTAHYWLGERVVKGSRSYGVGPERLLTGASTVRRVLE